ncbi:MAG: radical SAM family heme chaperone HemW [Verrucomicrobiaceae bacterium]|nr:radical SAM family heme chaperone HemW [Verrucomicrobiaceae bacterium]
MCPYCSFYKHTHGRTDMAGFVDAVLQEARLQEDRIETKLRTVFLGGGTPTALSEVHLERLLEGLRGVFAWDDGVEFSVEANPRTITASKATMMRRLGVTRVSLGVQAWDDATLATLGRDHTPAGARETFGILREAGFPGVNIDLMFSIPGQTMETWRGTLESTLELNPDHISAYNLNYEEDTEFFQRLSRGEFRADADADARFFYLALDLLEAAGFEHYEISNYARPGHRSLHNESYWLGSDYLGLGPGAFSTHHSLRWQNVSDTARYVAALNSGMPPPVQGEEIITPGKRLIERFGLELRTARGLPAALVEPAQRRMLAALEADGLLSTEAGMIRLTRAGKPLVDSIAVALLG